MVHGKLDYDYSRITTLIKLSQGHTPPRDTGPTQITLVLKYSRAANPFCVKR